MPSRYDLVRVDLTAQEYADLAGSLKPDTAYFVDGKLKSIGADTSPGGGVNSVLTPWQANQPVSPWSGAVVPTGTELITEFASNGTSGAVITVDNTVTFGGRPTTKVTFGGTPNGTAAEVGTSSNTVQITGVAKELLDSYVVVAAKCTGPLFGAKLYIGDATYANYYEVTINGIAADLGNGWQLLMADCTAPGVVVNQGSPNLIGPKRVKVTMLHANILATGALWVGFAGVVKKPKATVVLTCDDGYAEWDSYLFPAMKARGIPGSFSVDAGYIGAAGFMNEQQFRNAQSQYGDLIEYVNHGANNTAYSAGTFAQYTDNILKCDMLLESWGVPLKCRKIHTYVQGQYDQTLINWLVANGFTSAREVGASNRTQFHLAAHLDVPNTNLNSLYAIPASCNLSTAQPVSTVIGYIEEAKVLGSVFFIMGHEFKAASGIQAYVAGYHGTHGMDNLLDYLAAERDAGNIDIVKWSDYVGNLRQGRPVVGVL
jgi:hypothetical protein